MKVSLVSFLYILIRYVKQGKDKDGREIAVKQLRNSMDFDGEKFQKEFHNLSSLDHPNIVQLVGFCDEEEEVPREHEGRHIIAHERHRALCFEYMHNRNLRAHLSGTRMLYIYIFVHSIS